ncbi:MAG: amidohydrolase [Rothia sp. (in: high G+C Gram-positive bacteria)]|uniref:amidohydrolase n=1 Tax=Rothia sp. (in: high G+C Gram-positive bacteria) TaxID=1885016 RepID=UPI0026DF73C5|nr:amidohydrolase [Rothia sp. (in: high G+C Gram-positive bacteria)]MDO5750663.1 amidohydrolase [Rothia sp. (in: high G+C Gram-positive bacteria)]
MSIRIFTDGSVYTPIDPYATALLTDNGVTAWAGSDAGAASIADDRMERISLDGKLITPTFSRAYAPVGADSGQLSTYFMRYAANGYYTHVLGTSAQQLPEVITGINESETAVDARILLHLDSVESVSAESITEALDAAHAIISAPGSRLHTETGYTARLVGVHLHSAQIASIAPESFTALVTVLAEAYLVLSLDATSFNPALALADTAREAERFLTIRLDMVQDSHEHPITDEQLQHAADRRYHLGLNTTGTQEMVKANAKLMRRANSIGVSVALGSDTTLNTPNGWELARYFVTAPEGVSARSAFAALTRGTYRSIAEDNPFTGTLTVDTPATIALWNITELMVQAPDSRVASWSTDPRARIPLLPVLEEDVPLPVLDRIYVD